MLAAKPRDAKESTTHAWNQVISVIKPLEVELPVEHHLHLEVYCRNTTSNENAFREFLKQAIKNKLQHGTHVFVEQSTEAQHPGQVLNLPRSAAACPNDR